MTFQKYDKYEVMKIDDILKYLNNDQKAVLDGIFETIEEGHAKDGKPACNRYVVVNEDEPYAEVVWKLVELQETRGFTSSELHSIMRALDIELLEDVNE